jgi:hypothetical protein
MKQKPTLESLIKKYPLLLAHEEDSQQPFALFGFECRDGWYDIIESAFSTIMSIYNQKDSKVKYLEHTVNDSENYIKIKRTWYKGEATDAELLDEQRALLEAALKELKEAKESLPVFDQIKEKFGTLRMYYSGGDETTSAIVTFAENMSAVTCEVCGDKGQVYGGGWISTLCRKHAVERYGEESVAAFEKREEVDK